MMHNKPARQQFQSEGKIHMTRESTLTVMVQRTKPILLLAVAAIAIAGCSKLGGKSDKAPTGQVVATLDGTEITTREITTELQGMAVPPDMARRDAERLALGNIITRRMLAGEASQRELDKTPAFALQKRRAEEQLRVQALARDIAAKVSKPTRDEADKFIRDNPSMFRNRKFYILDQIQFLRPENIQELGLEDTNSMAEVEAILKANNIQFRRQPAGLDALRADPNFIQEVVKVLDKNPNELFMFASRQQGAPAPVVLVNQVKETREQPFTGDKAREFAVNHLRNQRIQSALKAEVDRQQTARTERVTYQEGWEPISDQSNALNESMQTDDDQAGPQIPAASPESIELPGGAEGLSAAHDPISEDDD